MNFFEHQEAARTRLRRLLVYFFLSLLVIVAAVNLVVFAIFSHKSADLTSAAKGWIEQPWWALITVFTLLLILFGNLRRSAQMKTGGEAVARWIGAKPLNMRSDDIKDRRFVNVAEEMSIASGMPMPALWVMESESSINAFAAAYRPSDAALIVTRGSLDYLARDELQALVAHEYSHLFHGDSHLNMRLLAWLAGITVIGQLGGFILRSTGVEIGNRHITLSRSASILGAALLAVGWTGVFLGRRIKASISRQLEYLADASAVRYTRDTRGITKTLVKIMAYPTGSLLRNARAEEISHMCFAQTLRSSATHPPIDRRILRLAPDLDLRKARRTQRKNWRRIRIAEDLEAADRRKIEALSDFSAATQDPMSVDASRIIESIGNPSQDHIDFAGLLYEVIPDQILAALTSPAGARLAVIAMLLGGNPVAPARLIDIVTEIEGDDAASKVIELHKHARSRWQRLRLTVLDLAISRLKKLPPMERRQFIRLVNRLIAADGRMSLFEFTMQTILQRHLSDPVSARQPGMLFSFKMAEREIACLLSLMIRAGGVSSDNDERYQRLLASFTPTAIERESLPELSTSNLNATLDRLNSLAPLLKESLVKALIECVLHDGHISLAEGELLRAVGESLDCPIPPLIAKQPSPSEVSR